jgi:type IV secretion system protein VirB6
MACPSPTTGSEFVVRVLAHLDCQAQTLGTFGFQALASPGSPAAAVLTGLLALFVALYAVRLLFSPGSEPRDLMNAVLKVGIVLTIAVSWPAWRVVAYDVVFYGPPDVAAIIMPSTMPHPRSSLPQRLQGIDQGIAALTVAGSGRDTGLVTDQANGFRSIALADESGLGWARPIYLASTIGALGFLRIASGLLLALAPLMAGLLLFDFSRGIFGGWLRGLAFTALGSLGATIVLAVQVAVMEPWIADALNNRSLGYATPTMPTELLAISLAFAIALGGTLFLLARVSFQTAWSARLPVLGRPLEQRVDRAPPRLPHAHAELPLHSHAAAISESVAVQMRREETRIGRMEHTRRIEVVDRPAAGGEQPASRRAVAEPLGSGHRSRSRRETSSHRMRDKRE